MTSRTSSLAAAAFAVAVAVATQATGALAADPPRPPAYETPFVAKVLPAAAGALIGGAAGFFIVPVLVPSVAVAATAGPPISPLFGFVGAGIGALVGSQTVVK